MIGEILRQLGEVQEKAVGVFVLIIVEPRHGSWVQELMEKSAAVSPLGPTVHHGETPGILIHAEFELADGAEGKLQERHTAQTSVCVAIVDSLTRL
jgi:hypothetical protein